MDRKNLCTAAAASSDGAFALEEESLALIVKLADTSNLSEIVYSDVSSYALLLIHAR